MPSRACNGNLVMATSRHSASQAVKVEETMMQRHVLCTLLQEDTIVDANFRLEQWQGIVNPRQLMNQIWSEVQELATNQSRETGVFGVSMNLFMCLAPATVRQYVSANLYENGQRSSAQVYPQS